MPQPSHPFCGSPLSALSCTGDPSPVGITPGEWFRKAEKSSRISSLDMMAVLLLMQPRMCFTFQAASAHCWFISNYSPISIPKSLFVGLISNYSSPSLYQCWDCFYHEVHMCSCTTCSHTSPGAAHEVTKRLENSFISTSSLEM